VLQDIAYNPMHHHEGVVFTHTLGRSGHAPDRLAEWPEIGWIIEEVTAWAIDHDKQNLTAIDA